MPQREPVLLCLDILRAARHIQSHLGATTREEFASDQMRRDAIERCFITVGEAMNVLAKSAPDVAARVTAARQIIGFRNMLVHGYALIDPAVVFAISKADVPPLIEEVTAIIAESRPDFLAP